MSAPDWCGRERRWRDTMFDAAQRVELGRTGLKITRVGFGCAPIGNLHSVVAEEDAQAAIKAAFDDGVRFIDAAPFYGYGLAEVRWSRLVRQFGGLAKVDRVGF